MLNSLSNNVKHSVEVGDIFICNDNAKDDINKHPFQPLVETYICDATKGGLREKAIALDRKFDYSKLIVVTEIIDINSHGEHIVEFCSNKKMYVEFLSCFLPNVKLIKKLRDGNVIDTAEQVGL
jgi:hypothetical protein